MITAFPYPPLCLVTLLPFAQIPFPWSFPTTHNTVPTRSAVTLAACDHKTIDEINLFNLYTNYNSKSYVIVRYHLRSKV